MTDAKDNSSLPLLLAVTGAVLVVGVGGWFLLDQEPTPSAESRAAAMPTPLTDTAGEVAGPAAQDVAAPVDEMDTEADVAATPGEEMTGDVDAELRKARLAADADILIFPPAQSALHYYGQVLEADPQHAIANAELDAILTRVEQTVAAHLVAEEYDDAYAIAELVAEVSPDHALVVDTQQTLDTQTEQLVEQAIAHAQAGEDEQADEALATAEALPARNPDYFVAIRDSITEIRDVRIAAERDRAQRARMAANQAKAAWVNSVREAIENGNLITPAGASARDLLAEGKKWSSEHRELTADVITAMTGSAQILIEENRLNDAEALVHAAEQLGDDADAFAELRASLETAFIAAQSNRVANMAELVRTKAVAPRYPRRAERYDVSGWVDIYFTVTPDGQTADIEVKRSEPEKIFDRAAIDAVSEWEFQPVEYRGQLISQRTAARLVFRIE